MNLKREISRSLYQAIRDKYESGSYRDAILAAIFHLQECIRQKANLERSALMTDALGSNIAHVFDGCEPSIQVNTMTTLAQVLEQAGFSRILQALYEGIKHPRIHADESFDDQKSANAIIIFIDYLLHRIQNSVTIPTESQNDA